MIETHVVNATLAEPLRGGDFFPVLNFLNGLVAPSFLFASGMAFAVTTRRKLLDYLGFGPQLVRQVGRLLMILAVGYILHLPTFSFTRLLQGETERAWLVFTQSDVLQCIAVTLLILQLILLAVRTERRLVAASGLLATIVVAVSPLLWKTDFHTVIHPLLAAYLNGLHYSLFPLFPWSAFIMLGVVAGFLYSRMKEGEGERDGEAAFMRRSAWMGAGLVPLALLAQPLLSPLYATEYYGRTGPGFVALRVGIVLLLLAAMVLFERRRGVSTSSPVTLVGRESLLVYATHLLLIYGTFGSFNFRKMVARSFGYGEAILASIALLLLMYGLALAWATLKRKRPDLRRPVTLAVLGLFVLAFFLSPGE